MIFWPILAKFLISKICLGVGLAGFLVLHSAVPLEITDLSNQVTAFGSQINKDLQGLPISFKKAELRPWQKNKKKFESHLSAQSFVVMDEKTESLILASGENTLRPLASITKLMTALVLLKNKIDWNQVITLEIEDKETGNFYIKEKEKATVKDFFYASLVGSSNSATLALVRRSGLGVEQFVKEMNMEADKLGLIRTKFVEPTGLSKDNQSTAKEMALLLKKALTVPEIKEIITTKIYNFSTKDEKNIIYPRKIVNTNQLLFTNLAADQIKNIIGGKTGFIDEAGYNFTVEVENADHNKIILVILGADSEAQRFNEARALASWVFKSYTWPSPVLPADGFDQKITADK